jgi:hypothetical protein
MQAHSKREALDKTSEDIVQLQSKDWKRGSARKIIRVVQNPMLG